ncbi:MAG: 50S ribosomal protein L22 [Candidatus Heimdallarchaeota archaeon]
MPSYKLSVFGLDPDRTAVGCGRDMRISPKHAREVCAAIRGLPLEDAKTFLEEVEAKKRSVPFKRHRKKVGHRKDLQKWVIGRYPIKAALNIRRVLENAENNSVFKGLDTAKLRVVHAAAMRGTKIKRVMARAQGRSSPKVKTLTHIEIVLEED